MLTVEKKVGDVVSLNDPALSEQVRGTVLAVLCQGTGHPYYLVEWPQGKFHGRIWEHTELDEPAHLVLA